MQALSATIRSMDDLEQRERQRLARRVRRLRKESELSQEQLGDRVGVSRAYIGNIERGEASLSFPVLHRLARALNVTIGELTDPDEPPTRLTQEDAAEYFLKVVASQQLRDIRVIGFVPADTLRWTATDVIGSVKIAEHKLRNAHGELFALEVRGDCLASIGILNTDIVILERPEGRAPRDRQLVLVHIPGTGVTLKRWCVTDDGIELRDGDERVVHRVEFNEDIEVQGFFVTFDPVAIR